MLTREYKKFCTLTWPTIQQLKFFSITHNPAFVAKCHARETMWTQILGVIIFLFRDFLYRDFSEIYKLSNRSLRGTFHGSTSNIFLPFGKKGPASFPAVSRAKKANLTIKFDIWRRNVSRFNFRLSRRRRFLAVRDMFWQCTRLKNNCRKNVIQNFCNNVFQIE